MKWIVTAPIAIWGALTIFNSSAYGALPASHPGPTVNDYTAEQSQRAEAAARNAGFGSPEIVMVQDGNFFLAGQKQGQSFSLTVTRDGKVYSSSLLPMSKS